MERNRKLILPNYDQPAAYGCLNMLLHGDGATNITTHNALDHFGFFADIHALRNFAREFSTGWDKYNDLIGPARQNDDLASALHEIDSKKDVLRRLLTEDSMDLSYPTANWVDVSHIIRRRLRVNQEYPTGWRTIHAIQRRYKHHAVFETMMDIRSVKSRVIWPNNLCGQNGSNLRG